MCGIFCLLSTEGCNRCINVEQEFEAFKQNVIRRGPDSFAFETINLDDSKVLLGASVLHLQGRELTKQPCKDNNSIFIYNGDIFGGVISDEMRQERGDTLPFKQILDNSSNILKSLQEVQGPYSFVYLNTSENVIYFGRDVYGRRSLLIGKCQEHIIITSIAKRHSRFNFVELPAIGVFSFDFNTKNWKIYPWKRKNLNFEGKLNEISSFLNQDVSVTPIEHEKLPSFIPPDSSEVEFVHFITNSNREEVFGMLLENPKWLSKVLHLVKLLEVSVQKRISAQMPFCQNCFKRANCKHSSTGILFSGGVDCAILALLADKFVEKDRSIDLMNVAFDERNGFRTPDRITGLATMEELCSLCPDRRWNFIEADVPKNELDQLRSERIGDLIYPLNSILDDSLGCALWFAARAKSAHYTSPCRILLVGMGADELFGGYTRHRAALQKQSWEGLHDCLNEDWQNLSFRNLGRDDRVVSDHGRQLRTPYLDENVVEFVRNLNSWEKSLPLNKLAQGIGEKLLLRTVAYKLGLKNAATLKKKALQFGSRIANRKEKAHEVSLRLS